MEFFDHVQVELVGSKTIMLPWSPTAIFRLVELRGFEPLTSALRTRHSTN
jgi:hypothetical protein